VQGRLLSVDPLEGVRAPQEKNARRPLATEDRYRATLAQADAVDPRGRFAAILTLARHTGRRIHSMCQLRAGDVCLTREQVVRALAASGLPVAHAEHWPHGALVWRSASDKLGFEAVTPIGAEVRAAIERYLRASPRLGDAPLFPATGDDAAPVHKVHAGYWLRRAETRAGLPKLERGAFHAFRRLWASERRHLPAQDVAAAGGWRSLQVMRSAYQHADAATVFAVLEPTKMGGSAPGGPTRDTARAEAKA
jgi:integrase